MKRFTLTIVSRGMLRGERLRAATDDDLAAGRYGDDARHEHLEIAVGDGAGRSLLT
jgi:hypothetical protein